MEALKRDVAEGQAQIEREKLKQTDMKEETTTLREKLAESHKLLASNKQVIEYLNRQINERDVRIFSPLTSPPSVASKTPASLGSAFGAPGGRLPLPPAPSQHLDSSRPSWTACLAPLGDLKDLAPSAALSSRAGVQQDSPGTIARDAANNAALARTAPEGLGTLPSDALSRVGMEGLGATVPGRAGMDLGSRGLDVLRGAALSPEPGFGRGVVSSSYSSALPPPTGGYEESLSRRSPMTSAFTPGSGGR